VGHGCIDTRPVRQLPNARAGRLLRRPLVRRAPGRQIHLLFQQRALVGEQQGGVVQRARHRLRAGVGGAVGSAGGGRSVECG